MKICSVGVESFITDGLAERRTDIPKANSHF